MMYHTLDIYCEECVLCVCSTKVRKIILQKYMGILNIYNNDMIIIYINKFIHHRFCKITRCCKSITLPGFKKINGPPTSCHGLCCISFKYC